MSMPADQIAPLAAGQRLVVLVAEQMAKHQPRRRFRKPLPTIEFVPAARESVASMLFLPDGWQDCCEAVSDFMRRAAAQVSND